MMSRINSFSSGDFDFIQAEESFLEDEREDIRQSVQAKYPYAVSSVIEEQVRLETANRWGISTLNYRRESINALNANIRSANSRLENISPTLAENIKSTITSFWRNAVNRYDTNNILGLSGEEFTQYRSNMLSKTSEIIDRYVPTEEQITELEQQDQRADRAIERVDDAIYSIESIEMGEIEGYLSNFSPENLQTPEQIENALIIYGSLNESFISTVNNLASSMAELQENIGTYNELRRNAGPITRLFNKDWDTRRGSDGLLVRFTVEDIENRYESIVDLVDNQNRRGAFNHATLSNSGEALNTASNNLILKVKEAYNDILSEYGLVMDTLEGSMTVQSEYLQNTQQQIDELRLARTSIEDQRTNINSQQQTVGYSYDRLENDQNSLSQTQITITNALIIIDNRLEDTRYLPEEERNRLEAERNNLLNYQTQLSNTESDISSDMDVLSSASGYLDDNDLIMSQALDRFADINFILENTLTSLEEGINILQANISDIAGIQSLLDDKYITDLANLYQFDEHIEYNVLEQNIRSDQTLDTLNSLATLGTSLKNEWSPTLGDRVFYLGSDIFRVLDYANTAIYDVVPSNNLSKISPVIPIIGLSYLGSGFAGMSHEILSGFRNILSLNGVESLGRIVGVDFRERWWWTPQRAVLNSASTGRAVLEALFGVDYIRDPNGNINPFRWAGAITGNIAAGVGIGKAMSTSTRLGIRTGALTGARATSFFVSESALMVNSTIARAFGVMSIPFKFINTLVNPTSVLKRINFLDSRIHILTRRVSSRPSVKRIKIDPATLDYSSSSFSIEGIASLRWALLAHGLANAEDSTREVQETGLYLLELQSFLREREQLVSLLDAVESLGSF